MLIFLACSKDNTSTCASFPTFSQDIEQIFISNCMPCHQTNNASGNVIFGESYNNIR